MGVHRLSHQGFIISQPDLQPGLTEVMGAAWALAAWVAVYFSVRS